MPHHYKKRGRTYLWFTLAVIIYPSLILFSWNSFAPDLFHMPAMQFKHALGLALFTVCAVVLFRTGSKRYPFGFGNIEHRSKHR